MKKIIFILSILLIVSCSEDKDIDSKFISLKENNISFDDLSATYTFELGTNSSWVASNLEDWVSLSQVQGDKSSSLILSIQENLSDEGRECNIIFTASDNINTVLTITQAKNRKALFQANLAFASIENMSFIENPKDQSRLYTITCSSNIFIKQNQSSITEDKFFLGNLVSNKLRIDRDVQTYKGYTFNPITICPFAVTVYSKTINPSKEEQQKYADLVLEKALEFKQSEYFRYDGCGIDYHSYRVLNFIGMSNMGTALDEVISGKSYQTQEMSKKNGIIYSFSQALFSLIMDIQPDVVKEDLKESDFTDGLSYISTITYGRMGLLLIESDDAYIKIKPIVNKILRSESPILTSDEQAILQNTDAYHIYFDKSRKLIVKKGAKDAIESYRDKIQTISKDDIYPLTFSVSDYFSSSLSTMTYNLMMK